MHKDIIKLKLIESHKFIYCDHLRVCRDCNEIKIRKYDGQDRRNRAIWRGEENRNMWHGSSCPKCSEIKRSRARGHLEIDDCKSPSIKEGRRCEILAKKYFESFGFKVELTKMHGPDLKLYLESVFFAYCEVKKVVKNIHKGVSRSFVNSVREKRKKDDLICYVFNDGFYVTSMKNHLLKINKSGKRSIKITEVNTLRGIDYNGHRTSC